MSYCTVCGNGTENFDRNRIKGERCEGCGTPRESLISKLFPALGAPAEDPAVLALCLTHGFGAVMSSASRQWIARDPVGALTVGPTVYEVQHPEKSPPPESKGLDLEAIEAVLNDLMLLPATYAAQLIAEVRRLRAGAEGGGEG